MTTPGSNGPDQQPGGGAPGWGQPPAGSPGGYVPPPPPPPGGATPTHPPQAGSVPGQYQPQPGANPYPPQGGAPYAPQGGAPYPPQGGPPYPPQGGAPYQPHPGGFGAPPKSGPPRWLIPVIAGVVLVVGALSLFAFLGGSTSEVGDCVGQRGVDEVEQVDCDDDSAVGEVIGFEDGEVTYEEYLADPASCEEFPDAIGAFWEGEEGEEGRVVCVGAR